MSLLKTTIVCLVISLALPTAAWAEDVVPDNKKPDEIKKQDGWDFLLTPGLSAALADSRSVIGATDGYTITLGLTLAAGAFMRQGDHQFRSLLNLTETFTRNPVLEEFVKAQDIFKVEALYLYSILKWLGPYARLSFSTSMFENYDARPEATTWLITRADGTQDSRTGYHLRLTDGFMPFSLKESAGFFALPYESVPSTVEFRLGFGGLHVFADDQLAVKDDGATPELDVITLATFHQGGGEAALTVWGEFYEKKIVYRFSAEVMMPFIYDLPEGDNRNGAELTNIDINATLSFKLLDWMSLDYLFRVLRQPQLLDEFQIQNYLLLTMSYSFLKPAEEK